MSKIKFILNNKIEIYWNDNYYKSSIQDITNEYIGISIPTSEGKYIPFSSGEKLEAIYYDYKDVYKFNTIVKGRKKNRIPMILLSIPNNYKKIQRRKFVRVPYVNYIYYSKVSNKIKDFSVLKGYFNDKENLKRGIIVDISGGGIRAKFNENTSLGDTMAVLLPLNDNEIIMKCKIIRQKIDDDGKYDCGLKFLDLDHIIREKIIHFIFQLMRKRMKKE